MKSPALTYNKNKSKLSFRNDANKLFIEKYIQNNKDKNIFKLNENKLIKKHEKLLAGKIYTFEYTPINKDILSYYDKRPIMFLQSTYQNLNTGNVLASGINFNFLPEKIKVAILEQFYRTFQKEIKKNEENIWEEKLILLSSFFKFLMNWLKTKLLFERYSNINLSFAFRNYIIDNIKKVKIIEYDDWEIVPFILPQAIVGESLEKIYKQYFKSLKNKNK